MYPSTYIYSQPWGNAGAIRKSNQIGTRKLFKANLKPKPILEMPGNRKLAGANPIFFTFPRVQFDAPAGLTAAHIAGSAGLPFWVLSKMQTNLAMAASLRFGETADYMIALPGALLFFPVGDLLDEVREQARIALLPEQNAISRLAVAHGAVPWFRFRGHGR